MNDEKKIKELFTDAAKGLATENEVKTIAGDILKDAIEKQESEAKKELDKANTAITELKKNCDDLTTQVRNMTKNNYTALKNSDGDYAGIFPNRDMAKAFGCYILSKALRQCNSDAAKAFEERFKSYGLPERFLIHNGKDYDIVAGETKAVDAVALASEAFHPYLVESKVGYGAYRRNAMNWPIGRSNSFPILTGDPEFYCPEAGVSPAASSFAIGDGGLSPKKIMGWLPVPRETMEDAALAIGEIVARRFRSGALRKEDLCGFFGDGTKPYFNWVGIIPALLAINADPAKIRGLRIQATAGAWSAIVEEDILALPGMLRSDADDGFAKWYTNRNFFFTVMLRIALKLGGTNATEVINTAFTPNLYYLGRPVELSPVFPKVKPAADHVPLLMGNLQMGAVLGDARAFDFAADSSVLFTSDSIALRATERIGMNNEFNLGTDTDDTSDDADAGVIVGLLGDIA